MWSALKIGIKPGLTPTVSPDTGAIFIRHLVYEIRRYRLLGEHRQSS